MTDIVIIDENTRKCYKKIYRNIVIIDENTRECYKKIYRNGKFERKNCMYNGTKICYHCKVYSGNKKLEIKYKD